MLSAKRRKQCDSIAAKAEYRSLTTPHEKAVFLNDNGVSKLTMCKYLKTSRASVQRAVAATKDNRTPGKNGRPSYITRVKADTVSWVDKKAKENDAQSRTQVAQYAATKIDKKPKTESCTYHRVVQLLGTSHDRTSNPKCDRRTRRHIVTLCSNGTRRQLKNSVSSSKSR